MGLDLCRGINDSLEVSLKLVNKGGGYRDLGKG